MNSEARIQELRKRLLPILKGWRDEHGLFVGETQEAFCLCWTELANVHKFGRRYGLNPANLKDQG